MFGSIIGFQEALLLKGLKIVFKDHGNAPFLSFDVISLSRSIVGFQEALLLKGLKIVLKDHGNGPFVNFDVISLSRTCRMNPV